MDCNRDEAVRAKLVAESKLEKKDFSGARKFALKAQSLYPGLDGVSQLLMMLGVYVASENKIGGEIDWYGVLGVNPSDDDEAIRKQYRKLALLLHPDKNKSTGADGAFKLISEAWGLLSDKVKRLAYNQRRGYRGFQQKVQMHTAGPSAPSWENGNFNFSNRETSVSKTQKNCAKAPYPSNVTPHCQRNDTFWTICHRCKMHYEYLKMYLNQTLLCPNCREAFMASETAPPFNYCKPSNQVQWQRQQNSRHQIPSQKSVQGQSGSNSFNYPHYRQHPAVGVGSTNPSIAAKVANVFQQAHEKMKRVYTETHASLRLDESVKRRRFDDASGRYGTDYNVAHGNGGFETAAGSRIYGFSGTSRQPDSTRDLTPIETCKMLMAKARRELLNNLNMRRSETTKKKDGTKKGKQERYKSEQKGDSNLSATEAGDQQGMGLLSLSPDNASNEDHDHGAASISVPDPDFHDFDQDRTESSFGDNEVWAAYDNDDGMPRFYALISKVISRNPFKLKISWLNSKTNSEFSTLDWVGSGFFKTCGEFRIGKYVNCISINAFSEKVNWLKGPRGTILIFPQKGDVWALYKNWSPEWSENTPDEIVHKYEMAIVLDDYTKNQGISVAPLVKVVGFKTVFHPNMDQNVVKRIPKEEMFRFSHRVPHHILTGLEAQNAPRGCLELDPAATPLELLQVITEGNASPLIDSGRPNSNEGSAQSVSLDGTAAGADTSDMS